MLNLGINAVQRGVGNTKIAMKTNVAANLVNLCFNFLLIEGRFGFPRLEEAGAALATTLGFVVAGYQWLTRRMRNQKKEGAK